MLIDRMDAFPQDFITDDYSEHSPRFGDVARSLEGVLAGSSKGDAFLHLTSEEKAALLLAYRKMMRQHFTANVIKRTFDREVEEKRPHLTVKAQGRYSVGMTDPRGTFGQSIPKEEGRRVQAYTSNGLAVNAVPNLEEHMLKLKAEQLNASLRDFIADTTTSYVPPTYDNGSSE